MRPVLRVERLAGEPCLDRPDVRLHVGENDRPLELRVREAYVLGIERLAARDLHDDVRRLHDLRVHRAVRGRERHHDSRVVLAGRGGVRVCADFPDAGGRCEAYVHALDPLDHPRHVVPRVAAVELEDRRLRVPDVREVHGDGLDRQLVHAPEVHHRVVDGKRGRVRRVEHRAHRDGNVLDRAVYMPLDVEERRDVRSRRAVHADRLRDVPYDALHAFLRRPREVERVCVRRVVRPHGRIDPHVLDIQDVREVAVEPAGVLRVAGNRMVDRAVADVQHPRVVDVHIRLEAARRQRPSVRAFVDIDATRSELAVLEREAPDAGRGRVVELQDVLVGVDPVPEEVDAVQEKHVRVRHGERAACRRRLDVRVLRRVAAPRALRLRGHQLVQLVGGVRHPHKEQVLDRAVRAVRDDRRLSLRRAADEVAGVVGEGRSGRRQRVERLRGRRAVPTRCLRGVDVHHAEVYVRVSHSNSFQPMKAE